MTCRYPLNWLHAWPGVGGQALAAEKNTDGFIEGSTLDAQPQLLLQP